MLSMSVRFVVTRASMLLMLAVLPAILVEFVLIIAELESMAELTSLIAPWSCEPLTALSLVAVTAPSATPVTKRSPKSA